MLFALSWLVFPGFGLIDLSVSWSPDWPVMLEAGWGLFFSVLVGLPFLVVAASPARAYPVLAQLGVATGALAAASVLGLEWLALVLVAVLAIEAAVVAPLRRTARAPGALARNTPLLVLAAAGAAPWLLYGWRMAELNRQALASSDITNGIDHYSVQAATAFAVVVLALLSAAWPTGRRLLAASAGIVALYLGIVSIGWPDAAGGFGPAWSWAAVAWGASVVAAGWWTRSPAAVRSQAT